LKREIGEAVRREFLVSEAGLITINDVDVAGDLKSATVFVSILGSPDQQKRGFQMLGEHRIRIQGLVARDVVLKYTPILKFVFDDSIVRGNRVLQIMEELEKTTPVKAEDAKIKP
jgi:ribosome-binding factor A